MKPSELKKIEETIRAIIRENKTKKLSRASIKKKLAKAGYNISDIEQALNIVMPVKRKASSRVKSYFPKARIPAFFIPDEERYRYSREAYGALMRLHSYQVLDRQDWKALLDRLTSTTGKIYLGEILEVLEKIVINRYPMEQIKVIFDVALGSKSMYH